MVFPHVSDISKHNTKKNPIEFNTSFHLVLKKNRRNAFYNIEGDNKRVCLLVKKYIFNLFITIYKSLEIN